MEDIKKIEQNLDKETKELIELSREMLRISRKMREEKVEKIKQSTSTPYEEAIRINPYLSKYSVISYY
ncbi:MAG: hypothetical protein OXI23_05595 [Gemmatimonadota bacterium]|nr:hypothetical protein [Gemmatimonadota bacterium]